MQWSTPGCVFLDGELQLQQCRLGMHEAPCLAGSLCLVLQCRHHGIWPPEQVQQRLMACHERLGQLITSVLACKFSIMLHSLKIELCGPCAYDSCLTHAPPKPPNNSLYDHTQVNTSRSQGNCCDAQMPWACLCVSQPSKQYRHAAN